MSRWSRLPDWFREAVGSLAVFGFWADYLLLATIVVNRALNGAYTNLQQASHVVVGASAWSARPAGGLGLPGPPRADRRRPPHWGWWRLGTWNRPPPVAPVTVPWWESGRSAAIAGGSVALFWMLHAG